MSRVNRHRGSFDPGNPAAYELSRFRIEQYVACPACFWLQQVAGVPYPPMIPFLLNSATDTLLKRDFDHCREQRVAHPLMQRHGLGHLVPFEHPHMNRWRSSLHFAVEGHFHTLHEPTNLLVGGGVDDIWQDPRSNELFVVDYKSTVAKADQDLAESIKLRGGYRRQMDVYQWVLRRMGFKVSNTGYFVYVAADQHTPTGMLLGADHGATMTFKTAIIEYKGADTWIESSLDDIHRLLRNAVCPPHAKTGHGIRETDPCPYGQLFKQVADKSR